MFRIKSSAAPRKVENPGCSPLTAEQLAVDRYHHFMQAGRCPIFAQQAAQDRPEVAAGLNLPQLPGGVLANLVGFTDGEVGHGSAKPNGIG